MDLYAEQAPQRAADNALRRHLDREEANEQAAAQARALACATFLGAILSGTDAGLPRTDARGRVVCDYTVATYLGESGHDARQVLLAACRHAMLGDAAASHVLLKQFVDASAQDYARDESRAYR